MSAGCSAQLRLSGRLGSLLAFLHADSRQELDEFSALGVGLLVHLTELLDMVGRLRRRNREAVLRLLRGSTPLLGPSVPGERAANVAAVHKNLCLRDPRLLVVGGAFAAA